MYIIDLDVQQLCWNLQKKGLKFGFTVVYFSITYITTMRAQGKVILAIVEKKVFFIKNPQKDMI